MAFLSSLLIHVGLRLISDELTSTTLQLILQLNNFLEYADDDQAYRL